MGQTVQAFLEFAPYGVFAIAALAYLLDWARKGDEAPRESTANFAIWGINEAVKVAFAGGTLLAVLKPVSKLAPFHLPATGWAFLLTLLVADLTYYWRHRAAHEIRLLWAFHSVHHSSNEYNLSTAIRLPWFGSLLDALFYVPAALLGFSPVSLLIAKSLVLLYQYWIHTEAIGKLGWLDAILNTPSNHRVHHASNPLYLDKNHGGILVVWDRLFGTFEPETVRPVYGLTHPLRSRNPFRINFDEPLRLALDLRRSRSLPDALGYLFRRPGWRPAARKRRPWAPPQGAVPVAASSR